MEKFKMPGVGIGVMVLDSDGKVLLILRNSNPDLAKSDMHLEGTWTLPAGKVGYGKTIIDAAKRKVKEEVNLTIENVKVIGDIPEGTKYGELESQFGYIENK